MRSKIREREQEIRGQKEEFVKYEQDNNSNSNYRSAREGIQKISAIVSRANHTRASAAAEGCLEWRSRRLQARQRRYEINMSRLTFNLLSVRGARIVGIDLLGCGGLVERDEAMEKVVACCIVVVASVVIWEVIAQGRMCQFLLEQIDLVQEEDDRGLDEPARVADGIEKSEGFLHSVDGFVFIEHLVVFGQGDEEHESRDIFEAMDPFLTFTPLTSNVEEAICEFSYPEHCLGYTGSLDTRTQNVLIGRHVAGMCHTLDRIKIATGSSVPGG